MMSRKQLFRQLSNQTVAEIFERFVASQTAKGVSDKTIRNYHSHLHSLQKHLDFSAPLATLTKEDLDSMVISIQRSFTRHSSPENILKIFGCRAVRSFSLYSSFPTLGSAKSRPVSSRTLSFILRIRFATTACRFSTARVCASVSSVSAGSDRAPLPA